MANKVRVNEEYIKKQNRGVSFSLKKSLSVILVAAIATSSGYMAYKNYNDVKPTEGYSCQGASVESDKKYTISDVKDNFVVIDVTDWKKGENETVIQNLKTCNDNGIPCGIMVNTTSITPKQAQADAACAIALIEDKELDLPIYYNIDDIASSVSSETLSNMCSLFEVTFNIQKDQNYNVSIAGKPENLSKLEDKFDNKSKLVICDGKEVNYDGKYDMCYFTRTNEYFSNKDYSSIKDGYNVDISYDSESHTALKGIDVSKHQGTIDWESVNEQGVDYAIIRIGSFYSFHTDGDRNIDPEFHRNISECQRLGIPYGVYSYTTADTVAEAKAEARVVVEELKNTEGLDLSLPVYYDIEKQSHFDNPKLATELCHAFMDVLKENGYDTAVYASYSLLRDMIKEDPTIMNENNWVAYYRNDTVRNFDDISEENIPNMEGIGKVRMVQVSEKGQMTGVESKTVDVNVSTTNTVK